MLDFTVELCPLHGWPAALRANPVAHDFIVGPQLIARLFVRVGNIPMGVDANGQYRLAELAEGLKIEIDVRSEAVGISTNDRQHQRHAIFCRADHRLRTSADSDPGFQASGINRRKYALILQRRPRRALPGDRLLFDQFCKQIEFFFEQLLILAELVSEQRERLGEGAASENDLGTATGCRIKRGKSLKHADRIVRTEHGHRRAQSDTSRSPRDRGQYDLRRRYREIGAVMLAKPDEIDADVVGQHRFVDHIANNLRVGLGLSILIVRTVAECVEVEYQNIRHSFLFLVRRWLSW